MVFLLSSFYRRLVPHFEHREFAMHFHPHGLGLLQQLDGEVPP
jgi:hypothetical protein